MKKRLFQLVALSAALMINNFAQAQRLPLNVSEIGSFHIGGRYFEISGKPTKEIVFSPGSAPAKIDPNGNYLVEQMYAGLTFLRGIYLSLFYNTKKIYAD